MISHFPYDPKIDSQSEAWDDLGIIFNMLVWPCLTWDQNPLEQ